MLSDKLKFDKLFTEQICDISYCQPIINSYSSVSPLLWFLILYSSCLLIMLLIRIFVIRKCKQKLFAIVSYIYFTLTLAVLLDYFNKNPISNYFQIFIYYPNNVYLYFLCNEDVWKYKTLLKENFYQFVRCIKLSQYYFDSFVTAVLGVKIRWLLFGKIPLFVVRVSWRIFQFSILVTALFPTIKKYICGSKWAVTTIFILAFYTCYLFSFMRNSLHQQCQKVCK